MKNIITEIDYLAHNGQDSNDPTMTLAVIERLAGEATGAMHGELWGKLTAGLK